VVLDLKDKTYLKHKRRKSLVRLILLLPD